MVYTYLSLDSSLTFWHIGLLTWNESQFDQFLMRRGVNIFLKVSYLCYEDLYLFFKIWKVLSVKSLFIDFSWPIFFLANDMIDFCILFSSPWGYF
mgnify:CR=1 FL=1